MKWLSFAFLILFAIACSNDKKTVPAEKAVQGDEKSRVDDADAMKSEKDANQENKGKNDKGHYDWSQNEQNKFLEDCRRESEEHLDRKKLKIFCSCMLEQAQKYYPDYRQMDEKSNEGNDKKIFASCLESEKDE